MSTLALSAFACGGICWATRCAAIFDPRALKEYESYVARVESIRLARFAEPELSWAPDFARREAEARLRSGKPVRRSIAMVTANDRIQYWNGTIIHWIGAIRIAGAGIDDLKGVLQDYGRYSSIYDPMIYECRAQPVADSAGTSYDVAFGLQNVYRFGSLFPQHYLFRLKSRSDYSEVGARTDPVLFVHWRATEIRESASGVPGRNDFLELDDDHGILWALNTYWLARRNGPDLYVEFESITLARSVRDFKCKIGIFPVPKSIVSKVMDSLPGESLELMLAATKAECERRVALR
jgi:hypothetical protein